MIAASSSMLDELTGWLRASGGVISPKIRVGGDPRGVYASEPVSAGGILLAVPAALLLTAGADAEVGDADAIILKILAERKIGDASKWAPWIRSLPSHSEFEASWPLLWHAATVAELCCPVAIRRAREQREAVRARFDALPHGASWHDYQWAWAVVESRALYLHEASLGAGANCVVPFGDMFNHHATDPSVFASYDAAAAGGGAFVFEATRDVAAGEELCLQYGAHDDLTLLLSYGFVHEPGANPHARSLLDAAPPDTAHSLFERATADTARGLEAREGAATCSPQRPVSELPPLSEADAAWLAENGLGLDTTVGLDADGACGGACFLTAEGAPPELRVAKGGYGWLRVVWLLVASGGF